MSSSESTTTRLSSQEYGACTLIEDLLPLYMEGEVSPGSRDLIVEHLARCERCAGFLAGAQSARAQLRRETVQRATSNLNSAPEHRIISTGQLVLMTLAVLFCCGLGALGSGVVWLGVDRYSRSWVGMGGLISCVAFVALLAVARARSPLTATRIIALLGSCSAVVLGTWMMVIPHVDLAVLLGLAIGIAGFAAMWLTIWQGGMQENDHTTANSFPFLQHNTIAVVVLLVGLALAFLGGLTLYSMTWTPLALMLIGALLVFGKKHDPEQP